MRAFRIEYSAEKCRKLFHIGEYFMQCFNSSIYLHPYMFVVVLVNIYIFTILVMEIRRFVYNGCNDCNHCLNEYNC